MDDLTSTITVVVGVSSLAAGGIAAAIVSAGLVLVAVMAIAGLVYYFCKKTLKAREQLIKNVK